MNKHRFLTFLLILTIWLSTAGFVPPVVNGVTSLDAGTAAAMMAPIPSFSLTEPAANATGIHTTGLSLKWQAYPGTAYYRYCLWTKSSKCPGGQWSSPIYSTSATLTTLKPSTPYYWWVNAYDVNGNIIAKGDGGAVRMFTTALLPGDFSKGPLPANGATNQNLVLTLNWSQSANATSYEYCLDFTNNVKCDNNAWVKATPTWSGTVASQQVSGLKPNSTYFWQIRALTGGGSVTADGNTWWRFSTITNPGIFEKLAPVDNATSVDTSTFVLSWMSNPNAASYEYCLLQTSTKPANNSTTCGTTWRNVGSATEAPIAASAILYDADYYWQVRWVNGSLTTQANSGVWWKFHTQIAPPGAFSKTSPISGSVGQPLDVTLTFSATSARAESYEYCFTSTSSSGCDVDWMPVPVGESSILIVGLEYNTIYYWQIRAVNTTGTTEANAGTWWTLQTLASPPGAFNKISPSGAGKSINPTLSWEPSAGIGITYQVCITDQVVTTCPGPWFPTAGTNLDLTGLKYNTTYRWQVRAVNIGGTTEAGVDPMMIFTTVLPTPGGFAKFNPANGATNQLTSLSLNWTTGDAGVTYEYCIDQTPGTTCDASWVEASSGVVPPNLQYGTTQYYWQVRAKNAEGAFTYADNGAWWNFGTMNVAPGGFSKGSPADGDTNQLRQPVLSWVDTYKTEPKFTRYEYCIQQSTDPALCTWTSTGTNSNVLLPTALTYGQTYHWQVRAILGPPLDSPQYADGAVDAWNSFTVAPQPPTGQAMTFNNINQGVTFSNILLVTNPSGGPVTFALSNTPGFGILSLDDTATGAFTYVPTPNYVGDVTFQYIVSDGISVPQGPYTVTLKYVHINHAPELQTITVDPYYRPGVIVTFTAVAIDPDTAFGDTIRYSLEAVSPATLPAGMTIGETTGVFGWLAKWKPAGPNTYQVRVVVTDTDGPLTDSQVITITVKPMQIHMPIIFK